VNRNIFVVIALFAALALIGVSVLFASDGCFGSLKPFLLPEDAVNINCSDPTPVVLPATVLVEPTSVITETIVTGPVFLPPQIQATSVYTATPIPVEPWNIMPPMPTMAPYPDPIITKEAYP